MFFKNNTVSRETESLGGTNETSGLYLAARVRQRGSVVAIVLSPHTYVPCVGSKVAAAGRCDMTWADH